MSDAGNECLPAMDEREKTSVGVRFTLLYAALYGGFIALNVFVPRIMETRAVFGLNLAVFYGLGLIVAAVGLALAYNRHCRRRAAKWRS